jgi:hypothetical protein
MCDAVLVSFLNRLGVFYRRGLTFPPSSVFPCSINAPAKA